MTEYDYNEDDGYYLVLYHSMDDGTSWQTRYSHLGSVKVQVGQQVVQGQEIAACGSTGASTRPPPALGSAEKQRTRRPADGL